MNLIVVEHFNCGASGNDCPDEGFEVKQSDVVGVEPEDFLLGHELQELQDRGITVEVVNARPPHFMDYFEPNEFEFASI